MTRFVITADMGDCLSIVIEICGVVRHLVIISILLEPNIDTDLNTCGGELDDFGDDSGSDSHSVTSEGSEKSAAEADIVPESSGKQSCSCCCFKRSSVYVGSGFEGLKQLEQYRVLQTAMITSHRLLHQRLGLVTLSI